jgi:two-component system KDP operon response regulator KdpE
LERILFVDDDAQIQKMVKVNLQARGYSVDIAGSGEEALEKFNQAAYDLILLDLILPGISGLEVCLQIREHSEVPLIVLSGRDDETLKIHALDSGADDYVTKPFAQGELLARVRAVMRRSKAGSSAGEGEVKIKSLTINLQAHRAFVDGRDMHLTRTEFALLAELAKNQEAVISHNDLLTRVWGPEYLDSNHYLHVYLGRVRKKLGADLESLLETVPGIGYILHSA